MMISPEVNSVISFVIEVSKSCAFYDSGVDKTITGVVELKGLFFGQ